MKRNLSDSKSPISEACRDPFSGIRKKVRAIFSAFAGTTRGAEGALGDLRTVISELDAVCRDHGLKENSLSVQRAAIIGEICLSMKNLPSGKHWTHWAEDTLREDIHTLQDFMRIAQSRVALQYDYLGTEKVCQLTRIEHLLGEHKSFEDLFEGCGLDRCFHNYSLEEFEAAVNVILNKELLNREWDIDVPDDVGRALSENFGLIEDNHRLLTRLAEAKDEEANMAKVITNLITNGKRGGSPGGKKPRPRKLNAGRAIEVLVQRLHEPVDRPDGKREDIDERLRFLKKLLDEYFHRKTAGNL